MKTILFVTLLYLDGHSVSVRPSCLNFIHHRSWSATAQKFDFRETRATHFEFLKRFVDEASREGVRFRAQYFAEALLKRLQFDNQVSSLDFTLRL
jgi:hypothetical protein